MEKIYGNRSARELDRAGGYFQRHMEHMTSENLNSKGDIALELAHRDLEFAALLTRHNALVEAVIRLQKLDRDRPLHPVVDGLLIEARTEVDRLIGGE